MTHYSIGAAREEAAYRSMSANRPSRMYAYKPLPTPEYAYWADYGGYGFAAYQPPPMPTSRHPRFGYVETERGAVAVTTPTYGSDGYLSGLAGQRGTMPARPYGH